MEIPSPRSYTGVIRYLRSHPILLLLLLSPGIPEYLSGSSPMSRLILDPLQFFLGLVFNLSLYGPGVILIREAVLHWKKGWASLILLGIAYAILEEGFAVETMVTDSTGQPVNNLAVYGRWMGVNWVWTSGIIIVHVVFSIALPIMLFGLTFPELKTRPLVSKRKVALLLFILGIDCLVLQAVLQTLVPYNPGGGVLLSEALAMLSLILIAWRIPAGVLTTRNQFPTHSPRLFGILGFLVLPFELFAGGIGAGANFPPVGTIALEVVIAFLLVRAVSNSLGSQRNERQKTAIAIGLVSSISLFGFIVGLASLVPIVALADLWMALYLRGLWRNYRGGTYVAGVHLPTPPPVTG